MATDNRQLSKLMNDESFLRWIEGNARNDEVIHWENWIKEDKQHEILVQQAQKLLNIPFSNYTLTEKEIKRELHRLNKTIDDRENKAKASVTKLNASQNKRKHTSYRYVIAVAAAVALLIGIISVIHLNRSSKPKNQLASLRNISVPYGKREILKLSDGSKIIVSAHSKLHYRITNDGKENVNVWLKGEAYFSIVHNKHRMVQIHTPEGIITDLGTQFDVNARSNATRVVLVEGKIVIQRRDSMGREGKPFQMKPRQMVKITSSSNKLNIKYVNTEVYTSWIHSKLVFDNTPVREAIKNIEEYYGVSIKVKNSQILKQRISGSIQNTGLKTALKGLAEILKVKVIHKNNIILMVK